MAGTVDETDISSPLELEFAYLWDSLYPEVDLHTQHRYNPSLKFTLDFAHLPSRTGIEIQGSIWATGSHSSGKGLLRDYEKQLDAAAMGWIVIPLAQPQFTPEVLAKIAQVITLRSRSSQ